MKWPFEASTGEYLGSSRCPASALSQQRPFLWPLAAAAQTLVFGIAIGSVHTDQSPSFLKGPIPAVLPCGPGIPRQLRSLCNVTTAPLSSDAPPRGSGGDPAPLSHTNHRPALLHGCCCRQSTAHWDHSISGNIATPVREPRTPGQVGGLAAWLWALVHRAKWSPASSSLFSSAILMLLMGWEKGAKPPLFIH